MPQKNWFGHYLKHFDTVEINASFYSWPTVANVQAWRRQPGKKKFVYTVKVCELITHIKRFKGTKTLIRDFGIIANILGDRMGCFLFQLPPSYRYTTTRLNAIVSHLDPARRNVVEFRHASWWNEEVTGPFGRPELSSVPAAGRACPTSLFGRPMKFTSACMAPSAGIDMTIQRANWRNGRTRLKRAGRREPGFTSITITRHMPRRMPPHCGACWGRTLPATVKRNAGTLPVSRAFSNVWENSSIISKSLWLDVDVAPDTPSR